MTEMLAVIAILAVVAGLVFVSLANVMRDMQQVELDGAAREIFVVAQNHLSAAESEGLLTSKLDKGKKVESQLLTQDESDSEGSIYYYAVDGTNAMPSTSGGILAQMLPFGSIDETISSGGAYVIKYNAKSATVLGVFYAAKRPTTLFTASTSDFAFSDADYKDLFPSATGYDARGHRMFTNSAGKTAMLGYYGGSDRDIRPAPAVLKRPTLEIVNAERLVAVVSNPMNSTSELNNYALTLQLVITGETSGNEKVVDILKSGSDANGKVRIAPGLGGKYEIFLDEIALSGEAESSTVSHFADLFGDDTSVAGTGPLIPGENITVQVKMFSTSKLTNIAYSAKATCNSLFDSLDATQGEVAIANLRHLENLGTKISGFNPNNASKDGWKSAGGPKKAKQVGDLSWNDFASEVAEGGSDAGTVHVLKMGGETRDEAASGPFVPVDLPDGFTYDAATDEGGTHAISGIVVAATSGDAGVFESCKDGKISNLEILNPSITAQTGNAGGLAGSLANSTVENVLVRHDPDSQASSYAVTGNTNAGGLVGSMQGGAVTQCAAAVLVSASGAGASAGGLVGMASAGTSGSATISRSYSGGHTEGGAYAGTANVAATGESGVAGGLVGALEGTAASVADCYSTCSASGSIAGGLVGSVSAGSSVAKGDSDAYSYSTGKVSGTTTGAFVGANYGSVVGRYLEIENLGTAAVGSVVGSSVDCSPMDLNASEFQNLSGSGPSTPYDTALIPAYPSAYQANLETAYQGKYPFKNIVELCNGQSLPSFLATHYGDWPATETIVVNVPAA